MTYVVNEDCIRCKFTDCVEICPVDAFREGETMLVIDPDTCIDCGVCEPQCPEKAIKPDTDADSGLWVEHNRRYAQAWPPILQKKAAWIDADRYRGLENKYAKYFHLTPEEAGHE